MVISRNLITGGCGFLGSHLAKELLRRGEEVICLDNFYTGSKQNIIECEKDFKFEAQEAVELKGFNGPVVPFQYVDLKKNTLLTI